MAEGLVNISTYGFSLSVGFGIHGGSRNRSPVDAYGQLWKAISGKLQIVELVIVSASRDLDIKIPVLMMM